MEIIKDRMTTARPRGLVVFLIGMRVNRWWKIHRWLPVALAMPRMLRELRARPESGYIGGITVFGVSIQYWESNEALLAYASDRSGKHFPAWADFYKRVGTSGDVGIWHEAYSVPAGSFETLYVSVPPTGLGRYTELVPARGHLARARTRMTGKAADAPLPPAPPGAPDVSVA
ncbi:MAG TPA: DUF4188 domain-containing protein [Polyangiaceae bacterium]|nr:DUF4188 domain-containing protein [Polyangiaceae bacterium]